jgi:hypothetical protein
MTRRDVVLRGAGLLLGAPAFRSAARLLDTPDARAAPAGATMRRFFSRPDLRPPVVTVLERRRGSEPVFVFLAPTSGPGQRGAMIVDDAGDVVWFRPVMRKVVTDFKVQKLHGEPVLTWWEGKSVMGLGAGEWVVLDSSYRELVRFSAARGLPGDLHEFVITPWNTALVTSNEVRPWDLRPVGGDRRGHVVAGVVQELALPSGRLLWEWHSLDHVAVAETKINAKPGPRFDYFHINSIHVAPDGHLIVSARNTWAAYKIDRRTGRVVWRLGGKRSDFSLARGARFEWQHDVREHADGLVSVFDNGAAPQEEPQSRALLLALDTKRMRVSLVHAFTHRPERVLSRYLGNAQLLDNGNVFVGWGGSPYVTEFDRAGGITFDARLPHGGESYRAFRFPWTGRPADRPATVIRGRALHVSWNGATAVDSWQLRENGRPSRTFPRTGFETALPLAKTTTSASAVALAASGAPLRASPIARIG